MPLAKPVVIGNWKMNGTRAEGETLVTSLLERYGSAGGSGTLGVCPPATLLVPLAGTLAGARISLGAQDCHPQPNGAFTGDISAPMIKDAGCTMVIVGHSERRHGHGESDDLVREKAEAALNAGLIAILCVGETEEQWAAGETLAVLDAQLEGSLPEGAGPESLVLAYEPVWAIGTGRTPTTDDIERTHAHLRRRVRELVPGGSEVRLLYGGSVKAKNAAEIMGLAGVDGVLVGGASLDSGEFWAIYEAGRAATG